MKFINLKYKEIGKKLMESQELGGRPLPTLSAPTNFIESMIVIEEKLGDNPQGNEFLQSPD